MNQAEAAAIVIDFVRDQAPEDKRVLRALKMLEKRHDVLRARLDRRRAVVAEDIFEEPLTVTFQQFRGVFRDVACLGCCGFKVEHVAFCEKCFARLDGPTAKAFKSAQTIHYGFCRALRFFDRHPVQGTDGMLLWPDKKGGADS